MNLVKKILLYSAGILFTISCVELNTEPQGGTVTSEQKTLVAKMNPKALEAELAGLSTSLFGNGVVFGGTRADDFGYPAVALSLDLQAADAISPATGYNWFSVASSLENRTYTYANTRIQWDLYYKNIMIANGLISTLTTESITDNAELKAYRGMALTHRAWAYFQLVQHFQFRYKENKDKLAVPIVTDKTTPEEAGKNPRATVQQVYDLILTDLNEAVTLFEGYDRAGNKSRPDKSVALGVRARVNLVMENWQGAYADAFDAAKGYTPLSKADASKPGFNNATAANWMWALYISPANVPDQYATWPSQMCSLNASGYCCEVAVWRGINELLWSKIPDSDCRKGWWVDENVESPYIPKSFKGVFDDMAPYTNIKFAAYDNGLGTDATNGGDWCMMRVEEMLLIQAEAKARISLADGKTILENWVKTYRDPSFSSKALDINGFINEVWFQRRVELWLEGFSFYDAQRLNKPIVRFNARIPKPFGLEEDFKFNLAADNMVRLLVIPQREMNANKGITENNPGQTLIPITPGSGTGMLDGVTD